MQFFTKLRLGKMLNTKSNRRGKGTGRSKEKKSIKDVMRLSSGFGDSSSSELSKQVASGVSECVVSLASFLGDTLINECTGMFIEDSCADATSILTAASLVGTPDLANSDDVTIKVCLPNGEVVTGWLCNFYSNYDLAVVKIRRTYAFKTVHLSSSHHMQYESNHTVVAVGRCFNSGILKSTSGIVISSPTNGDSQLLLSTCKIDKTWISGPLVDFEGNFVGMNCGCGEKTEFLPNNKIRECLETLRDGEKWNTKCKKRVNGTRCSEEKKTFKDVLRQRPAGFGDLSKLDDRSFSELSKQVASGVSKSVVSIASFLGGTLIHECTGIFIDDYPCTDDVTSILTRSRLVGTSDPSNTKDLTIKVGLPNEEIVTGSLYNSYSYFGLAVVNIKRTDAFQTVHLSSSNRMQYESNHKVVAVGRCFNSGILKSTNGVVVCGPINGDSQTMFSTCKTDEAWIGGPLVDFEGSFVGMNFECGEMTYFLPKNKIIDYLETLRSDAADGVDYGYISRYPTRICYRNGRYYVKEMDVRLFEIFN